MPRTSQNPDDARVRARQDTLRDARRQVVIDAARRVFERLGLENASIRAIAEEAGCTTGAIYPWFAGKEEIYAAILAQSLDRLVAHVTRQIARAPDALAKARGGVDAFYRYYQKSPAELSLGLYLFRSPGVQRLSLKPDLDRALNDRLARAADVMAGAIAEAGFTDASSRAADAIVHACGLLILAGAGRMKVLKEKPDPAMARYIAMSLPEGRAKR